MKELKEVFLTVLFAVLFMPLVAGASYTIHQYPNITSEHNANRENAAKWQICSIC